jgi:hypothetical protein
MGMFSESVHVGCDSEGLPRSLVWRDVSYDVCAEPLRWYERRQWWAEDSRAPLGSGPGIVDHEIWRVQVRPILPGKSRGPAPQEPLTFDLTRHLRSGRWRLLRIHDALHTGTA